MTNATSRRILTVAILVSGLILSSTIQAQDARTRCEIDLASQEKTPQEGAAPESECLQSVNPPVWPQPPSLATSVMYAIDSSPGEFGWLDTEDAGSFMPTVNVSTVDYKGAGAATSDGSLYYFIAGNTLGVVYPASGVVSMIGTIEAPSTFSGMDYDPMTDTWYGTTTSELFTIDIETLEATSVGTYGPDEFMIAIAFDADGNLYGHTFREEGDPPTVTESEVVSIDKETADVTVIGGTGFTANFGQGMAYDYVNDSLYMTAYNVDQPTGERAQLRSVDLETGETTLIGQLNATQVDAASAPLDGLVKFPPLPPDDPILLANPLDIDFGFIFEGQQDSTEVTLVNVGAETLIISDVGVTPEGFGVNTSGMDMELETSDSTSFWTIFSPEFGEGEYSGDVSITSNDPDTPTLSIPLSGNGIAAPDTTFTAQAELDIPDDGFPDTCAASEIDFGGSITFSEVRLGINASHAWRGDAIFLLESPDGTTAPLIDRVGTGTFGTSEDNFDVLVFDTGPDSAFSVPENHDITEPFYDVAGAPEQGEPGTTTLGALSDFGNAQPGGSWTLHACDGASALTGTLHHWSLLFYDAEITPAFPIADISPESFDFTVEAEGSAEEDLMIGNTGDAPLVWTILEAENEGLFPAVWSEDFDDYGVGSSIAGQGGWENWDNDDTAAAFVSDDQANSGSNSLDILEGADVVRQFDEFEIDSGQWIISAWQYIPDDFDGTSMFIMLNTYVPGPTTNNWSTQVEFSSSTGMVQNCSFCDSGGSLPMITGEWVEIRVEIDLDEDTQDFYYGDELLYSGTWTGEVSGGGALTFDTIDLFANGATSVYYDDVSVISNACEPPSDVAWLSADPVAGTTSPDETETSTVMVDAAEIDPGDYEATLCVTTNDPGSALVELPVALTVEGIATEASPDEIAEKLGAPSPNPASEMATLTVAVENGQNVSVEVFDVTGRRVQTLFDGALAAGRSETMTLDATALPAGVYVIRATGEDFAKTQRVTVVR